MQWQPGRGSWKLGWRLHALPPLSLEPLRSREGWPQGVRASQTKLQRVEVEEGWQTAQAQLQAGRVRCRL